MHDNISENQDNHLRKLENRKYEIPLLYNRSATTIVSLALNFNFRTANFSSSTVSSATGLHLLFGFLITDKTRASPASSQSSRST